MRYPQSPNHNQQVSRHTQFPRFFTVFPLNFVLKRDTFMPNRNFQEDSCCSLVSSCVPFSVQCSITLLFVFARPDDHCGNFFFFPKRQLLSFRFYPVSNLFQSISTQVLLARNQLPNGTARCV